MGNKRKTKPCPEGWLTAAQLSELTDLSRHHCSLALRNCRSMALSETGRLVVYPVEEALQFIYSYRPQKSSYKRTIQQFADVAVKPLFSMPDISAVAKEMRREKNEYWG